MTKINYTKVNNIIKRYFDLAPSIETKPIEKPINEFIVKVFNQFGKGNIGDQLYVITGLKQRLKDHLKSYPEQVNEFYIQNNNAVMKYYLFAFDFSKLTNAEQQLVTERINDKILLNFICAKIAGIMTQMLETPESKQKPQTVYNYNEEEEIVSEPYIIDETYIDPGIY